MLRPVIRMNEAQIAHIKGAGERAYPEECCGLLVGHAPRADEVAVTRIVDSPNVHPERTRDRFEIDPKIRFDVERDLRGSAERIIGHFHSHPDHPAEPSETDRAMAFEPELIWVIVAVADGRAGETRAFKVDEARGAFAAVEIES